jgi:hypothetical protein
MLTHKRRGRTRLGRTRAHYSISELSTELTYPVANGCPFCDCHPVPGLGRLVSATMFVPLSSHSPIALLVFLEQQIGAAVRGEVIDRD